MNIPLLFLLERMGIEADVSAVKRDALVRSVQLVDTALRDGKPFEGGVLYIGASFPDAAVFLGNDDGASSGDADAHVLPVGAFFLVNATGQRKMPDSVGSEGGFLGREAAAIIHADFDVYEAFARAVDVCFRYQEWSERFSELLQDAGSANDLMRECSKLFGNAAYMVDPAFKVIAIDDAPLFCEISHIWKHLVEEGYLLYDIVYSMQISRQLEEMSESSDAEICESEHFNNPFINFNMSTGGVPLGHFFIVGYQKRITSGEVALANLLGRQLAGFVDQFGLSQRCGAPYEAFVARLMEDAPMDRVDIARQIAPWGWRAEDMLCILAVGEKAGGTSLQDILMKQLSHELGMMSITVDGVVVGMVNVDRRTATGFLPLENALEVFLEKHHCIAGMSDVFEATKCSGAYFRQAKTALSCLERQVQSRKAIDSLSGRKRTDNSRGFHREPLKQLHMRFNDCFTESLAQVLRSEGLVDDFVDSRVSTLLDYDLRNGTEYLRTLEMYLKCERRLNETAEKLFVHRNTLLYRIGRIKEILGDDLGGPESRMRLLFSIEDLKYGA